jgi:DNA-binding GntR family transcriptional regulator
MAKSNSAAVRPATSANALLHEAAYDQIRSRILNSQLLPDEPLSEYQLAIDLNMSRTPIREALKRLEHDGLVRFVVNRGAFVRGLSASDISEIYEVREQLEGFAAFTAATNMRDTEIAALERELAYAEKLSAQGRVAETFESDVHLHRSLIACTHNDRLASILATLADQVHRVRVLSPNTPGRIEATLREHEEILSAVKRRDGEAARAAMVRHLRAAHENAIQLLMMRGPAKRLG